MDTELAADAQPDFDDILFTASDGTTKLSHEIEKYNAATGELVAWVKVPTVSSTVDTVLYMYYGNGTAGNQQDAANVWDANYKGVWHLKEDPSGGAPQMKDSTSSPIHGTSNGTMTSGDQVAGKIDGSLDFDGSDDLINLGNSTDFDVANVTLSAWAKLDSTFSSSWPKLVSKGSPEAFQIYLNTDGPQYQASIRVGGSQYQVLGDNVQIGRASCRERV